MPDPHLLTVVAAVFFLAAIVKGIVGFGLPLVSVGLLSAIIGLPNAIAVLVIPSLLTNLWQGLSGPHTAAILRRFWPFFLMTALFTWPGTMALAHYNDNYMSALLGGLLILFVVVSNINPAFRIGSASERPLNLILGSISGLLSGMTGAFTVPGVLYLQSVGMKRDELVQALGLLFSTAAIALALSLGSHHILDLQLGLISVLAVIPTFFGLWVGTRLRRRTTERSFRILFLGALAVLGTYILARALIALASQT